MPRKYTHPDQSVNQEFDEIYNKTDLLIVSEEQPKVPRLGMIWIKPSTNTINIYNGKIWNAH